MKRSYIVMAVIAGVILVSAGWLIAKNMSDDKSTSDQTATSTPNASDSSATNSSNSTGNTPTTVTATITYTDDGFSPDSLTVKTGTTVTVKNDSSQDLEFSSDPHPAHTENPELNEEVISPGESVSFTVTKTGTFGYHNHLDDNDTGTIVVQ